LKTTTATNRKISWFAREDGAGALDLSPHFQRRPVWVYIRSSTSADGSTSYEVVDGQQRIRSILDFANNDLELIGDDVTARWHGKVFEDLSDDEKTRFWTYEVVTRELESASDGDIRDLFRRLNIHAVTLNDQELRHAQFKGEFIELMESLAEDEWWLESRIVNVRQVRRMEDVEFVSELFISLIAGPQDKKKTLDQYYEDFENSFPDRAAWTRRFKRTRELLTTILKANIRPWSGKSDFYTLFSVLGRYVTANEKWTESQIDAARTELRSFRVKVDQAKKRDNRKQFAKYIHEYADAVTRAATDVARRQQREKIIRGRLDATRS
jgi:hypothetical protein